MSFTGTCSGAASTQLLHEDGLESSSRTPSRLRLASEGCVPVNNTDPTGKDLWGDIGSFFSNPMNDIGIGFTLLSVATMGASIGLAAAEFGEAAAEESSELELSATARGVAALGIGGAAGIGLGVSGCFMLGMCGS
jgi:hypothetical protein